MRRRFDFIGLQLLAVKEDVQDALCSLSDAFTRRAQVAEDDSGPFMLEHLTNLDDGGSVPSRTQSSSTCMEHVLQKAKVICVSRDRRRHSAGQEVFLEVLRWANIVRRAYLRCPKVK